MARSPDGISASVVASHSSTYRSVSRAGRALLLPLPHGGTFSSNSLRDGWWTPKLPLVLFAITPPSGVEFDDVSPALLLTGVKLGLPLTNPASGVDEAAAAAADSASMLYRSTSVLAWCARF